MVWSLEIIEAVLKEAITHHKPLTHGSFSGDGRKVVTTSYDNTVRIWDVHNDELVAEHTVPDYVLNAALDEQGNRVLTCGRDNAAVLRSAATGRIIAELEHEDTVHMVRFSHGNLLTASSDHTARIWTLDPDGRPRLLHTPGHPAPVLQARFTSTDDHVVTLAEDDIVRLWDPARSDVIVSLSPRQGVNPSTNRPLELVKQTALSQDGRQAAFIYKDGTVHVVGVTAENKTRAQILRHPTMAKNASFSANGKYLLTTCHDMAVRLWELHPEPDDHISDSSGDLSNWARSWTGVSMERLGVLIALDAQSWREAHSGR